MKTKTLAIAALAATTALAPVSRALADNNAAAFVFGALAGAAIERSTNDHKGTPKATAYSPTRAANRETQEALNYFGFNAGTPDGILGQKSRAATSQYQAHMGYPITGALTEAERNFLISSYYRAQAGGTQTAAIAAGPGGAKQLLTMYQAEAVPGGAAPAPGGDIFASQPAPTTGAGQPADIFASQPSTQQPTFGAAPVQEASATTSGVPVFGATEQPSNSGGMPSFFGSAAPKSLASHCSTQAMVTNTNGGFQGQTASAEDVIGEQICVNRTYAMAQGEQLEKSITGVTTAQIEAQCAGMAPLLGDLVTSLGTKPRDQVIGDAATFVASSGVAVPQLVGTAKICLSVGYRTDKMDLALGSALILAAADNKAYGELIGHHRALGFGVSEDAASAVSWYQMSLDALDGGAAPVFNPGQPERKELVRSASLKLQGNPASAMETPVTETSGSSNVPIFSLQ